MKFLVFLVLALGLANEVGYAQSNNGAEKVGPVDPSRATYPAYGTSGATGQSQYLPNARTTAKVKEKKKFNKKTHVEVLGR